MKTRETYLSFSRIICAIAVIMIHTNVCFWEFNINNCWKMANLIEGGLAFAVPVFLMISGATLMDYSDRYTTKEFFVKRLTRTVIPFMFWSIIGGIYDKVNGYAGSAYIYYFFIYLFGIYICIPFFAFIKKEYKEKVIFYITMGSFIFNYFVPFIYNVLNKEYVFVFPFEIAGGFLIYPLVGYLISKKNVTLGYRLLSYGISIIGFIMYIGGTYFYSIHAGYIVETFRGYTNLPCLFMCVGVFMFLKEIGQKIKHEKLIFVIEKISKYTFSVYLIHYYIINIFIQNIVVDHHSLFYRLVTPFITFTICVVFAWVMKKIPIINKILP